MYYIRATDDTDDIILTVDTTTMKSYTDAPRETMQREREEITNAWDRNPKTEV